MIKSKWHIIVHNCLLNNFMNKETPSNLYTKEQALRGEIILATKEGIELLDKKILETEEELLRTMQSMGESAKFRDLRENYEFRDLRLKATDDLPKAINELKQKRTRLTLVEPKQDKNEIGIGDRFTSEMYYPGESEPETTEFHLLGPIEVELNRQDSLDQVPQRISYLSPIGSAVWGVSNKPGTEFSFRVGNTNVIGIVK